VIVREGPRPGIPGPVQPARDGMLRMPLLDVDEIHEAVGGGAESGTRSVHFVDAEQGYAEGVRVPTVLFLCVYVCTCVCLF
jgi:hypothetical protein